jgi:hypothetical protein
MPTNGLSTALTLITSRRSSCDGQLKPDAQALNIKFQLVPFHWRMQYPLGKPEVGGANPLPHAESGLGMGHHESR